MISLLCKFTAIKQTEIIIQVITEKMTVFRCVQYSISKIVTVDMSHVTDHVAVFVVVYCGKCS